LNDAGVGRRRGILTKFLKALALKFYRGIGPDQQTLVGLEDFNFFIGANNAGKSIILNFLAGRIKNGRSGFDSGSVESYRGTTTGEMEFSIGIPLDQFVSTVLNNSSQKLEHLHEQLI
jgi:ATPase subunit of ABC transporter with duplicated ATPase domains